MNGADKAGYTFYKLVKIAQSWSRKEHVQAKDITEATAESESIEEDRANCWETAAGERRRRHR
jgi:hypothetical protein